MTSPFPTTPYVRALDNGATLKSLASAEDAERLAVFNGQVFGDDITAMTRAMIAHHPTSRPEHWLYVEDGAGIASSLVLIPWQWRYDDVTIKCGEMGIVGTRDDMRGRGLVRALNTRFAELLHEGGFHLSIIQGIPYFYRQFGYEYALPLEMQWQIELRSITTERDATLPFRLATHDDIPALMRLYDAATRPLDIAAVRDAETWRYILEHARDTATESEVWLIEREGAPLAYYRIPRQGFGEGLIVSEASPVDLPTANALLAWLKETATARAKPYIRLNLHETTALLRVAQGCGAYQAGGYQWQIRIVDAARLLRQIAPVLERRVADSPLAGMTRTVAINLYRSGLLLHFEAGRLREVEAVRQVEGEIGIPPDPFMQLVLGWRTGAELDALYPDVRIKGQSRLIVDVLFPRMSAFVDAAY